MTATQATATTIDIDIDMHQNPGAFRPTHEIHTSTVRSFLGCRRRWGWATLEGYVPKEQPKPLEFGIAFHRAMEVFYDPETWFKTSAEQKTQNAIAAFLASVEEQRVKYLKLTHQERILEADGDDYTERIELGIGMLEYYGGYIHPEQDKWFKPVMVEVPFQVPLLSRDGEPLTCSNPGVGIGKCGQNHPIDAPVTFDGRIDMIVEDIMNGGYYIWDHKSAAQIRKDDSVLQLDPQVGGYSWAAQVMLDMDVRGFVYVEYRKDFPKPPKVLTRAYKGRIFTTDKNFGTDLAHYMEALEKHHPQGLADGVYEDYIAYLKSKDRPRYHERFPVVKTKKQLANIGEVLYDTASEMVNPGLRLYPTVGQFSCNGCAYRPPCLAMFMGDDYTHSLTTSFNKVK